VQHLGEGLSWSSPVKAFSGCVVIGGNERLEARLRQGGEIGLSRNEASQAADGVLDAAFLPGRVRVAEEGLDREPVQPSMPGELGAVVEGDRAAQAGRQRGEDRAEVARDTGGLLVRWPHRDQQARLPLVHGEHGVAVASEQHEVGFPVARGLAVGSVGRAFGDWNPAVNEACGATAPAAAEPPPALAARQVVPPAIVLRAGDLGIDEAVDALVADDLAAGLAGQPSGHLLRRPALRQAVENSAPQGGLPFQARARPAPRSGLLLGVTRLVADLAAAITPYLTRDGRWRAIQSCRDLPERAAFALKAGNLASLVQR
jgi:hypothetical protein